MKDLQLCKDISNEAFHLIRNTELHAKDIEGTEPLVQWLLQLIQLQPSLTEAFTLAKAHRKLKEGEIAKANESKTPTMIKFLCAGETTEEARLEEFLEQLIADNRKAIESIRTIISLRKSEMEQINYD